MTRFIFLFLLLPLQLLCQIDDYELIRYDASNGLSAGSLSCIMQDKAGLMWFGTQNGLVKYDGYSFEQYKGNQGSNRNFTSNVITSICESKNACLFVGTREGLYFHNKTKDSFELLKDKSKGLDESTVVDKLNCGKGDTVYCIAMNNNNLYKCVYSSRRKTYSIVTIPLKPLYSTHFFDVKDDNKGNLWFSSLNYVMLRYKSKVTYFHFDKSLSEVRINKMRLSPNGMLLILTNKGIFTVNEKTKAIVRAYTQIANELNIEIDDLCFDKSAQLYIATNSNGLYIIGKNGQIKHHYTKSNTPNLKENSLHALYVDNNGSIWTGLLANGLALFHLKEKFYQKYLTVQTSALHSNTINCFLQTDENTAYIGTDGGGLSSINLTDYTIKNIESSALKSNKIVRLVKDNWNMLWIASYGGGLSSFDLKKKRFAYVPLTKNDQPIENVYSVYRYSSDSILVATLGQGLLYYSLSTKTTTAIDSVLYQGKYLPLNMYISTIQKDSVGHIIVTSLGEGVYVFDEKMQLIDRYYTLIPNRNIKNSVVTSLSIDEQNQYWIGTINGLSIVNPKTNTIRNVSSNDGLLSSNILNVCCNGSNIWITTVEGVSKIDSSTLSIQNYTKCDGIYTANPTCNYVGFLQDSTMVFGGLNGLMFFNPDSIKQRKIDLNFKVLSCKIKDTILVDVVNNARFHLTYDQNNISLEFAALQYAYSSHINYEYSVSKGATNHWIDLKNKHSIYLANLSDGKYIVKIKAYINGKKNEAEIISFTIFISPPFWKTWWFISLIVTLVLVYIASAIRRRIYKMQRQAFILEQKVFERTQKINNQKEELQAQTNKLKEINDELVRTNSEQTKLFHILKQTNFQPTNEQQLPKSHDEELLEKTIAFIHEHIDDESLSVEQLGILSNYSKIQFYRKIKALTGLTPIDVIRTTRLKKAEELLVTGKYSIADICFKVGFTDPRYFSKCFKEQYDCSPTEYLRKNIEE